MSNENSVSKEVLDYAENLSKQLEIERTQKANLQNQLNQSSLVTGGKEQNVIELQLNVENILDKCYHLLSGHEVKINSENNEYWGEPDDDRLKTFSNYGIKQVMNLLSMYININTLMAFYDAETIKWKVKDFGIELSDLFTNRYEALLYYPSPEELFEKYKPIVQEQGLNIDDEKLYQKCVQWSEEELSAKENLLPIICWGLIDMVHSTYTRAYAGKERQSLGERGININQSSNGEPVFNPNKKGGFLGMFKG